MGPSSGPQVEKKGLEGGGELLCGDWSGMAWLARHRISMSLDSADNRRRKVSRSSVRGFSAVGAAVLVKPPVSVLQFDDGIGLGGV
jgi:hypothetical protein